MNHSDKIKLGIVGYGNLGKGAESAIRQNADMELIAVFTRRSPESIQSKAPVYSMADLGKFVGQIDVMLLCGGSAKDLPEQTLQLNSLFNTVDSFDNHGKIPEYFASVDQNAKAHGKLSLISTGWDPGLFSLIRLMGENVLPSGKTYTFWGKGLSQGHSDAIRRVKGVKHGVQYTLPNEAAMYEVRSGAMPELSTADKHRRVCYVVAEEGAEKATIEMEIKTMPNYFLPYHTEVHFINEEDFFKNHTGMPHGGLVLRSGVADSGASQQLEFSLKLESNPDFTSSVLVVYARAVARISKEGRKGAITVLDVPPGYLSPKSAEELRKELL